MSQSQNHRDVHRVPHKVYARFGTAYPEYKGEVVNLSPGGLLIQSGTVFPVNTLLVIELHFPGNKKTFVRGEVVRTPSEDPETGGMGISLTTVSEDYLTYLQSFYIV